MSSAISGLNLTIHIGKSLCPVHVATCGDLLSETGVKNAILPGLDHRILTVLLGRYLGVCSTRTLLLVHSRGMSTVRSNSRISCSILPVGRLLVALETGLSIHFANGRFRRTCYSRTVADTS